MRGKATRFQDKHGKRIHYGDLLHVEEYPDKYVGGSYNFEGLVEEATYGRESYPAVVYRDIGEEEGVALAYFPKAGREILGEQDRYEYFKTKLLGDEPPEELWKGWEA